MSDQSKCDTLTPMKKTQRPPMDPRFFPIPWHILDEPSPGPARMKPKQVVHGDPVTPVTPIRRNQHDELQLQSNQQTASPVHCPTTPLPSRKHVSPAVDVTPPDAPNKSRRLSSTMPDGTSIKNIDDDDDDDESAIHDVSDSDKCSFISSPGLLPTLADIPDGFEPSDDALDNAPSGWVLEWDFLSPSQKEWVMRQEPGGSLNDHLGGGSHETAYDAGSEGGNSNSSADEPLVKSPSP